MSVSHRWPVAGTAERQHGGVSSRGTAAPQCPVLYGDGVYTDLRQLDHLSSSFSCKAHQPEAGQGEMDEAGYDKLKPAQP
jgi:hypothetical protein